MVFNSNIVNNILDNLLPLPEQFGVVLFGEDKSEPIHFNTIKNVVHEADPDADICFGMSKMAILSPNIGNAIIKIPFNGYFFEDNETGAIEWNPFHWAQGTDPSDYCLTEYEKYERLKTYDLECFVAKTIYYKTKCGVRIFIQERVIPESETLNSPNPTKNSRDLAEKWKNEDKFYIDSRWIATCIDKYGQSKVERFLYYCSNLDLDILEDVHSGNFGYRLNEEPCILDFSNYGE